MASIRREREILTNDIAIASQLQEQEMLVISKQAFHVLSHVCREIMKFDDASKYLDCIELSINEQKKYDELLYNQTMAQLRELEKKSSIQQISSTFNLEGKRIMFYTVCCINMFYC